MNRFRDTLIGALHEKVNTTLKNPQANRAQFTYTQLK